MADDKIELEELRLQLNEVTAERDRLRAENRRLRRNLSAKPQALSQVNLPLFEVSQNAQPITAASAASPMPLNNESSMCEKAKLFRPLFHGREDVFARMWWSSKNQRIGYSPVCRHEWNPALCDKPRAKCGDCPNQDFAPVTDEVSRGHLV